MNLNIFSKEKSSLKNVEHYQKAREIIPGGANIISKFPARFPIGSYPLYIKKAYNNIIVDLDDNHYLDWTSGLGTNILGYTNSAVKKAIKDQLECGLNYSYSSELEYTLSKKITYLIPSAKAVHIFKTGSDTTNAAVRVARAVTKKNKILMSKSCYHGNADVFCHSMDFHNGIPDCYSNFLDYFEYNNIDSVKKVLSLGETAAVILEPAILDEPNQEFLKELHELCVWNDVILIFDEMVTFARSPEYSVQTYTGITPDLTCIGKSLGNGLPISCLGGRTELMECFDVDNAETPVFYSGTYNGTCLSLASAIATLTQLKRKKSTYPSYIGKILSKSGFFEGTNYYRLKPKYGNNNLYKSVFMEQLASEEILLGNIAYPNYASTIQEANHTVDKILEVKDRLEGLNDMELSDLLKGQQVHDFNLRK